MPKSLICLIALLIFSLTAGAAPPPAPGCLYITQDGHYQPATIINGICQNKPKSPPSDYRNPAGPPLIHT